MTPRTRRAATAAGAIAMLACARPDATGADAPDAGAAAPARLAVAVYGGRADPDPERAAPAAAYRVLAQDDASEAPRVVASGRTGEEPVLVPAGVVTLIVDLDPPERVGPFRLFPDEAAQVRIVDTLDAALPSRIWRIERGDEAVGHAFPPPDELPARTQP